MSQRANDRNPFRLLVRANRIVVLAMLWAAIAACIVGALAFDVADWLSAWRGLSIDLTSAGTV